MVYSWLFAAMDRFEAMRKAFDGSRGFFSDSDVNLVIALATLFAASLALCFAVRIVWKSPWLRKNPYLLFWELCWAHRLSIGDCLLLLHLTRQRRMDNPAIIFLEPDAFANATTDGTKQPRFESLYHRLF